MKKLTLIAVTLAALTTSVFADSDDHHRRDRHDDYYKMSSQEMFEAMDANKDKKISLAEYIGFSDLDKNGDGSLSYDEFKQTRKMFTRSHEEDDDHHMFKRFFKR
jgi:hypothetical protein